MPQHAQPHKHGRGQQIRWYGEPDPVTGKRKRYGKTLPNKELAREYRDEQLGYAKHPFTVAELVERFLANYGWKTAQTKRGAAYKLSKLPESILTLPAETVALNELQAWSNSLSAGYRWEATQGVKQLFKWAHDTELLSRNVAARLRNPQPEREETPPFESWEEVEAVAAALGPKHGHLAVFLAATGLRPQELIALERRDVNRSGDVAILAVERCLTTDGKIALPKNGKKRSLPLSERALAAIDAHPYTHVKLLLPSSKGRIMDYRAWRRNHWNPALIECGFVTPDGTADRGPYALRHTFATWALREGLATFTVARRMGTSIGMIEKSYGHHATDAFKYEAERFNRMGGLNIDAEGEEEAEAQ